jgi:hypothetical protein
MRARSRLATTRKIKRIKREIKILGALLIVYFALKLLANIYIFHPVEITANTDREVIEIEKPIEVVKEIEVDRTFTTEKQQILAYIVEKFGDDSADAITMIRKCENSSFDQSRTNHNRNGTVDYGVMQINSVHTAKCGEGIKDSWKTNIDCGYEIYKAAGNKFTPWTCATEVGQKNYLSN